MTDQSKVAVSWAARLAAAQLRGDVNALAVLVRDVAGEGEAPVWEVMVAAVELTVAALGLSPRTVDDLLGRVYVKCGVRGRNQLADVTAASWWSRPAWSERPE